ncbi:putative ATP-binding cassette transporter [Pseudonocardia hierapolitana]|uniref:Putative ATP-binding cassette transporter n=1 Tax=Pseudonocardia hierapolitana TaxID=1128676 RepID=A0A561T5D0_9PSEU|nr:ABC transporter ATP-binding protein/permease [Pseudonocardia hierapolitana]TWF82305.1 putative ATP-binding cassette transporter [Pseudonocardia hierapolitana]
MGTELDWSTEWLTSTLWIAGVFVATTLGCAVLVALLSRYTVWGRQFRRLAFPYFSPRGPEGWRPLLTVLLVLLLAIASVRLSVLFSYQGNGMLTALQNLDAPTFWRYIGIFGILATIHVTRILVEFYIQQALIIRWRVWITDRVIGDWLDGRAYHKGRYTKVAVDNPDQRIQEDTASFPSVSVTLGVGAVSSLVSLVSFTLILWQLSGPLTVLGVEVPRAMTFLAYVFVIIASVIAFRIGRPLILLNFLQERFNATFRYALVRLRENSENVAFQRGERVENGILGSRFRDVISNAWAIVFRSLKFQGFNLGVSQLSVVFPYMIQAPRFFSQQITLGDLNQTATAFGEVHDALSFFRNAYDDFASYRAVLDRLTGLLDADAAARALPAADVEEGDDLQVRDLTVRRPDERVLVDDLDLDVAAGTSLLVTGPSGGGKTTLLRSVAQLWPYTSGSVRRPTDDGSLFLPQQPYLPLGTLRDALAYPGPGTEMDDARAAELLRKVQLPQLADQLDEVDDWARRLSPGEQQRLGFARILVVRPKVAFLDEATSALDEGLEQSLYNLLREELPDMIIVSVGHRSSLRRFHDELLELDTEGRWEKSALRG